MKKIIAMLLVLVMALGLFAGCKKSDPADTTTGETQPNASTSEESKPNAEGKKSFNIYGIYKVEAPYFAKQAEGTEQFLKEWGEEHDVEIKFHNLTCDSDVEKCLTHLDTAIGDKADAILICVPDQTMSQAVVDKCKEANIPVLSVDDGLIDADGNPIAPSFGIDAYNIGVKCGTWVAEYAVEHKLVDDPAAGIMYMQMPTVSSCVPRTQGEKDAWSEITGDALSDRVFYVDYNSDENECYNGAASIIAANPNITKWIVMVASEHGSNGAAAALEEAGLAQDAVICSLGGEATLPHWDEGNFECIRATCRFSGVDVGSAAAEAACEFLLNGTEIPMDWRTPGVIMTMEDYLANK